MRAILVKHIRPMGRTGCKAIVGAENFPRMPLRAVLAGPWLVLQRRLFITKRYALHHLTDTAIDRNNNRRAIIISNIKRLCSAVCIFLHSRRRINRNDVTAMTAGLQLIVVTLRGLQRANARTDTHDIKDNCRQFDRYTSSPARFMHAPIPLPILPAPRITTLILLSPF